MAPRVLVSDKLSPAAIEIFKARGIDVDFEPDLGKDKDALLARIGDYDGLAIRSATKVTAKIIEAATNLKVIGRAGIGVDNVEIPAASARGIIVMNTPFGNTITTAETRHLDDAGAGAADTGSQCIDPGREMGEIPLHGCRVVQQDTRPDWLRQYRIDCCRQGAGPAHAGHCV